MKIAFYKGTGHTVLNFILSWGVKIWTWGEYSHVELIDCNGSDNIALWDWYSASAFAEGIVRVKTIDVIPDNWDFFDIDFDLDKESVIEFFNKEMGKKYDWIGILFSQLFPLKLDDKNTWFCSEIVKHALCISGIQSLCFDTDASYSPNRLFRELKNEGILK